MNGEWEVEFSECASFPAVWEKARRKEVNQETGGVEYEWQIHLVVVPLLVSPDVNEGDIYATKNMH